jgi:CheY-like chemotaxis protein
MNSAAAREIRNDDAWTTAQLVITIVTAESVTSPQPARLIEPSVKATPNIPEGFDHVLWVDDLPNNNTRERRAFEAAGLQFTLALSTNEALAALEEWHFAAIISDMGRIEGKREGYVLLDALRKKKKDQTPLCFYAGSNSKEHKAATRSRGGQECTNNMRELSQFVIQTIFTRCLEADKNLSSEKPPTNLDELKHFLERVQQNAGLRIGISLSPMLHIQTSISIDDPPLHFGRWVKSRERHSLNPTQPYRLGIYQVRNLDYEQFVKSAGYEDRANWRPDAPVRTFLCKGGKAYGPSTWEPSGVPANGTELRPVSGISFYEADAFCRWLHRSVPRSGWTWQLPTEDMWEYAARCRFGSTPTRYPWGNSFEIGRCNCFSERKDTSDVGKFDLGNTPDGCADMAGNVWEFVIAPEKYDTCVLRGGGFQNNDQEVRADLRLWDVSLDHRPTDFGFRCALVRVGTG